MRHKAFIEAVEATFQSPRLDLIPVGALMHILKIWPWSAKVRDPSICIKNNISVSHDVLP